MFKISKSLELKSPDLIDELHNKWPTLVMITFYNILYLVFVSLVHFQKKSKDNLFEAPVKDFCLFS